MAGAPVSGQLIERLEKIARLSGGRSLKLSQVNELATALVRTPRQVIVRREQHLWDNWLLALLIIGLVGTEWIVRRRSDLL